MLSRLPVDGPETADPDEKHIYKTVIDVLPVTAKQISLSTKRCLVLSKHIYKTVIDVLPVTAKQISLSTKKCPVLSKVYGYILSGWPQGTVDEELEPFYQRRILLF